MPSLVLASKNKGKLRELKELLVNTGWQVASLDEYPAFPDILEDGETFRDNAVKKAVETARILGDWALADDSGLEVDVLGGAPGVRSARFAGRHGDDGGNNRLLLERLEGVNPSERSARFRCVTALAAPDGRVWTADGVCEGQIGLEPRGNNGFGYDPLFILESGLTMAELPEEEKNRISHRARAMHAMGEILVQLASAQEPR